MDSPIRYAQSGDFNIAYKVVGDGPRDLIFIQGSFTNLGVLWEDDRYRSFCQRVARYSRLILFDKRGMGLSDRVEAGTMEDRMDDVRAVLDAAGSQRAFVIGVSEGGLLATLFAASHPDRTEGLILIGGETREENDEDWAQVRAKFLPSRRRFESCVPFLYAQRQTRDSWGRETDNSAARRAPSWRLLTLSANRGPGQDALARPALLEPGRWAIRRRGPHRPRAG